MSSGSMKKLRICEIKHEVSGKLRDMRVKKGLSIDYIAEKTGRSKAAIIKLEMGRFFDWWLMDEIARICDKKLNVYFADM